ncbi:MAG: alpha-L-fucosidase, partial [Ginsengibacter sp.]
MKIIYISLFTMILITNSQAQTYTPTVANLEARQQFQDAKFGLFIHWGVFSILGDAEWVMNNQNIKVKDYTRLMNFFNPTEFNAHDWV